MTRTAAVVGLALALFFLSLSALLISDYANLLRRKTRRTSPMTQGLRDYFASIRYSSAVGIEPGSERVTGSRGTGPRVTSLRGTGPQGSPRSKDDRSDKDDKDDKDDNSSSSRSRSEAGGALNVPRTRTLRQSSVFGGKRGSNDGMTIWAIGGKDLCIEDCNFQEKQCHALKFDDCLKTSTTKFLLNHCKNWSHQKCKADNLICRRECQGMASLLGESKPQNTKKPKDTRDASSSRARGPDRPAVRVSTRPKILRDTSKKVSEKRKSVYNYF